MDWLSGNLPWISYLLCIAFGAWAVLVMSRMGSCGINHAGGRHHDTGGKVGPLSGPGAVGPASDKQ